MSERVPFHAAFVFIIAVFMTAGCAKQEVVRKDEGFAPAPAVKRIDTQKFDATDSRQANALPATQVAKQPAPAQQTVNTSSVDQLQSALNKIYFNFDSANISDSARDTLSKNAAVLAKEPAAKIRIEGNCDERGSAEYNLALGERRAKAAQQYLVTLGVKPERLAIISYGKEKPAVQGNDESAWAKNRRDEFVVVK